MRFSNYRQCLFLMATMIASACGSDNTDEEPTPIPEPDITPTGRRITVTVLDYSPAPGQFVNQIPEYESGDTQETIKAKATTMLNNGDMITLGSWGGSVTLKLGEPIDNKPDAQDFRVLGNSVYAGITSDNSYYGSAEPGIILVMSDSNGNGLPDDTWYELSGDMTDEGQPEYTVTYHRPTTDATNDNYIYWQSTSGDNGYINRNSDYHTQDFFPMWLPANETMTFSGRRLPDNGLYNTETGRFDLTCYNGYADSHPNNMPGSCIDLDSAIDKQGNHVSIISIDFIKIYTGVLQSNGPLGECSTEVAGIEVL